MNQFRRVISAEASLAWKSNASKYINSLRNSELFKYQKDLCNARKSLIAERADLRTKDQARKVIATEKFKHRTEGWNKCLSELKSKINNQIEQVHGKWAPKAHPCRPTIDRSKNLEERLEARRKLDQALKIPRIMRRKYIKAIQILSDDFISMENMDEKIEQAIMNPVSYNISAERLVAQENLINTKLRSIKVSSGA